MPHNPTHFLPLVERLRATANGCPTRTAAADEIARLREALQKIAEGQGYYGSQAREYKEIARTALAGGK